MVTIGQSYPQYEKEPSAIAEGIAQWGHMRSTVLPGIQR